MRDKVRFLMAGEIHEIRPTSPTETVLNWLRTEASRKGTKEGCGEGDCGACTVLLGELIDGKLNYKAVNACIQFLPTLDGKHLVAVEDLHNADGSLHAVQRALVDEHGSQCGFCTPGFAMSLYGFYLNDGTPTLPALNDALAGNLCRCTGYGPIVEAGKSMFNLPCDDPIRARETEIISALESMRGDPTLSLDIDGQRFLAPRSADELAALYMAHPDATILAGGTDVGLWVTKQLRRLETVIYLGNVTDLHQIEETELTITIPANVSNADALPVLGAIYPEFGEMLRRFGSTQVRNAGTFCGNVANGSPIGDNPPVLIALNATVTLRKGNVRRRVPIEAFFVAYGKQDRAPGEFVESIEIPKSGAGWRLCVYKISKRFDQDISALCGAFNIRMEGDRIADARIAFGGMAATPARASGAEKALIGQSWSAAAVDAAISAMGKDFTPIDDMRASAAYRSKVAGNLLRKVQMTMTGSTPAPRLTSSMEIQ